MALRVKNQIALDAYGCPEIIKVMEKLQKSCVSAKSKSYEKVVIPPPWRLMFGAKRQGPPAPKARIQKITTPRQPAWACAKWVPGNMSPGPPKLAALDGWILLNSEANAMPAPAQEVFCFFGEGGGR